MLYVQKIYESENKEKNDIEPFNDIEIQTSCNDSKPTQKDKA